MPQKGILLEKTFNLKSPNLKKDLENFENKLRSLMTKYNVTHFVPLEKKDGDRFHVAIIPCSPGPGGKLSVDQNQMDALSKQGFAVEKELNVVSNVELKNFGLKSIEFKNTLSFGAPKQQNQENQAVKPTTPSSKDRIKEFLSSLPKDIQGPAINAFKGLKDSNDPKEKANYKSYLEKIGFKF